MAKIQEVREPCKWCGGKGKWVSFPIVGIGIECTVCHIGTGFRKSEDEALRYWKGKSNSTNVG